MSVALSTLDLAFPVDFERLADGLPHIVWAASPDGSTEYFNRGGAEFTGLPPEANYGYGWVTLIHPEDAERAQLDWARARDLVEPLEVEWRVRRADGIYRWMTVRGRPILNNDGTIHQWVGTCTDIQDQKDAQGRLARAERASTEALTLLDTLQSSAPVGFVFVDREFRCARVNETAAVIAGSEVQDLLGLPVADVVPDLWPQIGPHFRTVLEEGQSIVNCEVAGVTPANPQESMSWLTSFYPVRIDGEVIGIGVVFVDITERKEWERSLASLTEAAVAAIAATVEARDPYTAGHQRRVADLACAIARKLGLDAGEVEGIRLAANIHDIGKVAIPSEILTRPARLNPAEFEVVKTHCRIGYNIVSGISFPWPVADMILQHHERIDGTGYPEGLHGDDIFIGARIIAVADVVESMASHRPYRATLGIDVAVEEIERNAGRLYDADVASACIELFRTREFELENALVASPTAWGVG